MEFGQDCSMETFHVGALKPVLLELIWIKPIGHHIFPLGFVVFFMNYNSQHSRKLSGLGQVDLRGLGLTPRSVLWVSWRDLLIGSLVLLALIFLTSWVISTSEPEC